MPEKLVRDEIPRLIAEEHPGTVCFRAARAAEQLPFLMKKLEEECGEFLRNPSSEEAADVVEVLMAIAFKNGTPLLISDIERVRIEKAKAKGIFARFHIMDFPSGGKPVFPDWQCQNCARRERGGMGKPMSCPTCRRNAWEQVDPLPIGAKLPEGEKDA